MAAVGDQATRLRLCKHHPWVRRNVETHVLTIAAARTGVGNTDLGISCINIVSHGGDHVFHLTVVSGGFQSLRLCLGKPTYPSFSPDFTPCRRRGHRSVCPQWRHLRNTPVTFGFILPENLQTSQILFSELYKGPRFGEMERRKGD